MAIKFFQNLISSKRNLIWMAASLVVVFVLAVLGIFMLFYRGDLNLSVSKYPVVVQINNREYEQTEDKTYRLQAGKHELAVSRSGFVTERREFGIARSETTNIGIDLELSISPVLIAERDIWPVSEYRDDKIVYFDKVDKSFKSVGLDSFQATTLTERNQGDIAETIFAEGKSLVLLKANGLLRVNNFTDRSREKGADFRGTSFVYPNQDEVNLINTAVKGLETTWIFDWAVYNFGSVQPILLNPAVRSIAWSPDATQIAYTYDDGQNQSLIVAKADGTEWRRIIGDIGNLSQAKIHWSADLNHLLLQDEAGQVFLINLAANTSEVLLEGEGLGQLKISPERSEFMIIKNAELRLYDFDGDYTLLGGRADIDLVEWLDADRIVFVSGDTSLYLYNVRKGSYEMISKIDISGLEMITRLKIFEDRAIWLIDKRGAWVAKDYIEKSLISE